MSGIIGGAGSKSGILGTTELDYEEGAYTPSITFGGSAGYSAFNSGGPFGFYTKVGRLVTFNADLYPSTKTAATGTISCTLPITPANISGNRPPLTYMMHRLAFGDNYGFWYVNLTTGVADMYYQHASTSSDVGFYDSGDAAVNTSYFIAGSYMV
jgi:hypothetical protein